MTKNILGLLLFLFALTTAANAQVSQNSLEFIRKFKGIEQDLVRERVYLHTDRDWYFHGDRIWFSAYVVAGPYNFASGLSEVLYVELFDPEGELIERVNVNVFAGRGEGSITFEKAPNQAGRYRLKAYTAWALNFGESYAFVKDINVFKEELELPAEPAGEQLDVQFFPESGYLVNGIPTRVGVKAVASDGYGADISGTLHAGDNELGDFQSIHLGMGYFELTPTLGEEYYALVNGQRFTLPEVQAEGVVLRVVDQGEVYEIDVASNRSEELMMPLLFAHVRGEVFAAEVMGMENGFGKTLIPKSQFPTGVVHFTVLDDNGVPAGERLAFNRNLVDEVQVNANLIEQQITARQRTGLQFLLNDKDGAGVPGTASLSVFDDSIEPYNLFGTNIRTRFFLESEVEGYVENPGFYFSDDVNAMVYSDLLMMTQGWRAYDMSSIIGVDLVEVFSMPEKGFRISGKITGGLFGREQKDAPLFFSMGEEGAVSIITTDEEGEFLITDIDVTGSQRYQIKANTESGRQNISIRMDEQFAFLPEVDENISKVTDNLSPQQSEVLPVTEEAELSTELITERAEAASADAELFIDAQMQGVLDEITVTSDRLAGSESGVQDDFATQIGRNPSGMGTFIDMDERPDLQNYRIQEVINSLPGASVIGNQLSIQTNTVSFNQQAPPLVMVNGVNTDFETVLTFQPEDIRSISVLRSAIDLAIFGAEGSGGALIITTRRGTRVGPVQGYVDGSIQGYQIPATFYSPRYGVDVPTDLEKKDNRITLHWDPSINFSERGIQVLYWGNDIPSTYRIVLEGITTTGTPFAYTNTFELTDQ